MKSQRQTRIISKGWRKRPGSLKIPSPPRDLSISSFSTKRSPVSRLPLPARGHPTRNPSGVLAGSFFLEETSRNRMPQDLSTRVPHKLVLPGPPERSRLAWDPPQHALSPQQRDSWRRGPQNPSGRAGRGSRLLRGRRLKPPASESRSREPALPATTVLPVSARQVRAPHRAPRRRNVRTSSRNAELARLFHSRSRRCRLMDRDAGSGL